jgi:LacI family transcriptional regulator
MPDRRPTLRSLALEAGVSAAAFSLALRNSPEVAAKTRHRLQRLAQRRGYQPDPTIAKLMQHLRTRADARAHANICALRQIFPSEGAQKVNFGSLMRDALERRAKGLGFAFEAVEIGADGDGAALERILLSRGVEGIVIMPMMGLRDLSGLLDWNRFSIVSVTSSVVAPRFHSVMPNHFDNILRAYAELAGRGFKRIGLAISKDWDERVRYRWTGGMAWQNQFGKTQAVPVYLGETRGPAIADSAFSEWLGKNSPDAVLLESIDGDLLEAALGKIPPRRRPKIVALNWPNKLAEGGIDQRVGEIGSVAVEMLAGMISRGEKGIPARSNVTMVDGDWVWRG